ncbi:MAG: SBBP repeat-containing protein, partial [Acidobacteria bacterium]|nr:SBBP repeat-containing protein [Acidobacteriota bacterium]
MFLFAVVLAIVPSNAATVRGDKGGKDARRTSARPAEELARRVESPPTQASAKQDAATKMRVEAAYGQLPLSFEANRGQVDRKVDFISRGHGYTLFLTPGEAVLTLAGAGPRSRTAADPACRHLQKRGATLKLPPHCKAATGVAWSAGAVLRIGLVGGNRKARGVGRDELPGKVNYFIGKDPTRWRANVSTYAKVAYADVYPGVDVVYYGNQRHLEYDFVVHPGADPGAIALDIQGANSVTIDAQGDLVLRTAGGEIRQPKPRIYQEINGRRRQIPGGYVLHQPSQIGFEVDDYDTNRPLVIDPVLVYSTYLGGNRGDFAEATEVDAAGNAYVTGYTASNDFPATAGAFDTTYNGNVDVFVTKLNPSGSAPLIYSTYLGGSGE